MFNPDDELLKFAKWFSENYQLLKPGDFYSDNKNYHVKYKQHLTDNITGLTMATNARVGMTSGTIELDKTKFSVASYSPNFMFYIILWCVAEKKNKGNLFLSDEECCNYYLTTNRDVKDLINGYLETVKLAMNTEITKQRLPKLSKLLSFELSNTESQ